MILDYSVQKTFMQSISIADPGNTCLRGTTVDVVDFLIFIKTVFGKTSILTVGPVIPDVPMLINGLSVGYQKFDYKEGTIQKNIEKFINDARKNIVNVEEISFSDGFEEVPDLQELFLGE